VEPAYAARVSLDHQYSYPAPLDSAPSLPHAARAADDLLLLAPRQEPPAGFESTVVSLLPTVPPPSGSAPSAPDARRFLRRRWPATAAAIITALVVGVAIAQARTADDRDLADRYRQTLATSSGRSLHALVIQTDTGARAGTLFLYEGSPSWVLVSVTAAPTGGPYRMVVVSRDGATNAIGTCRMRDGTGTAAYRLDMPVSAVSAVQLISPEGLPLTARD
jgi:hypothetical protein